KKESLKGNVKLKSAPGIGTVVYQEPKKGTVKLSEAVVFPISHLIKTMDQAEKGARLVPYVLFDGASKEGPLRVNTFISKSHVAGSIIMPMSHDLLNRKGWTMRMAFYPVNSQEAAPDYELEIVQLSNGVVPFAVQEFSDFSIEMTLKKLETVKPMKCS
ncbi:MAG: DUF1849 family protein, partial [Rhodospirillales bacterium]